MRCSMCSEWRPIGLLLTLLCRMILLSAISDECSGSKAASKRGEPLDRVARNARQVMANSSGSDTSEDSKLKRRLDLLDQTMEQLREANQRSPPEPPAIGHHYRQQSGKANERHANVKRLFIEDPSLSRRDPLYMNACHKRIPSVNITKSPTRAADKSIGQAESMRQLVMAEQQLKRRSRRSISGERSPYSGALINDQSGKSLLYLRGRKGMIASKQTSFILSGGKSSFGPPSSAGNKRISQHHMMPTSNRYLYSSNAGHDEMPTKTSKLLEEQAKLEELMDGLRILDLKSIWQMNCIRNTISIVRSMPSAFIKRIDRELLGSPEPASEESIQKARDRLRLWMPAVESYLNKSTSFEQQTLRTLTNLAHGMQYFNLVMEQMVFEQVAMGKKSANVYLDMEQVLLKIQCDIENLRVTIASLEENYRQMVELRDKNHNNELKFDQNLMQSIERRLKYRGGHCEDPFRQLMGGPMLKRIGQDLYLKREIMPLQHRYKDGNFNIMLRDQLIFKEMADLLSHLELVLAEISK